jgi:hypothetical protein
VNFGIGKAIGFHEVDHQGDETVHGVTSGNRLVGKAASSRTPTPQRFAPKPACPAPICY